MDDLAVGSWCPNCRSEFVEGWGTCSNCGVELVDSLPPETTRPTSRPPPERGDHDDPFVPIWEGPSAQADLIVRKIESAHIPVDFGEPPEVGHARIEVPRSYLAEVRDVLNSAHTDWPPPVTYATHDGFDWKPIIRLALVAVAALLIAALVLAR